MSNADATSPRHYARLDPEPIDVITSWGLDYLRGNVVKYLARAGHKLDTSELGDLEKARVYLDRAVVEAGGVSLLHALAARDLEVEALRARQEQLEDDLAAQTARAQLLALTARAAGDRIRELETKVRYLSPLKSKRSSRSQP